MGALTGLTGTAYRGLQRYAPSLYVKLIRWRGADFYPVTPTTDLVIAGAPGSANSYARAALLMVNPDLHVSSHAHVWTEVRDGVKHGRPVLLLVREPVAEAASRLTRFGNLTPAQALRDYAELHEKALRWAPEIVVARFEDVCHAYGDVVRRVNARYGTSFTPFPHEDEVTVARLQELLASANGAVPAPERDADKAAAREQVRAPELAALRERCQRIYQAYLQQLSTDR